MSFTFNVLTHISVSSGSCANSLREVTQLFAISMIINFFYNYAFFVALFAELGKIQFCKLIQD